jgi:hypothetical protein
MVFFGFHAARVLLLVESANRVAARRLGRPDRRPKIALDQHAIVAIIDVRATIRCQQEVLRQQSTSFKTMGSGSRRKQKRTTGPTFYFTLRN